MYSRVLGCCTIPESNSQQTVEVVAGNALSFNPGVSSITSNGAPSSQSFFLTPEGRVNNSTVWRSTAVAQPLRVVFTYSNGLVGGSQATAPFATARSPGSLVHSGSRKELPVTDRVQHHYRSNSGHKTSAAVGAARVGTSAPDPNSGNWQPLHQTQVAHQIPKYQSQPAEVHIKQQLEGFGPQSRQKQLFPSPKQPTEQLIDAREDTPHYD